MAEEYPDDERNLLAVELLEKLVPEIEALNGSDLHDTIEEMIDADVENTDWVRIISEELRDVGFRSFPETGRELLEQIASRLEK